MFRVQPRFFLQREGAFQWTVVPLSYPAPNPNPNPEGNLAKWGGVSKSYLKQVGVNSTLWPLL